MRKVRTRGLATVMAGSVVMQSSSVMGADSLPRGVGPEFAQFYPHNTGTFTCLSHPSISLPISKLNDHSCDCPDGSDEPGTSACAYLSPLSPPQPLPHSPSGSTNTTPALPGFWCENAGHVGAYLPFMYVNDGVCDHELCCDGSDEYAGKGGVKCKNRCDEIGKVWRRLEKEKLEGLERANKKRRTMAKESRELRRRVEAKIKALEVEIKQLAVKRDELKVKYEEVEREEREKMVQGGEGEAGGKLGVLVGLAKQRVDELRNTLTSVVTERNSLRNKVSELESILSAFKEEHNPNFNDEGVKVAVRAWEEYAANVDSDGADLSAPSEDDIQSVLKEDDENTGINWASFTSDDPDSDASQPASDTDVLYSFSAYLPSPLRDLIQSRILSLRHWLIDNGILADNPARNTVTESRRVTAARQAFEAAENDLNDNDRDLGSQQADLEKDYGPDDIFRQLRDKCVSADVGEYEYELCWLGRTSQRSKKGGAATTMGNYEGLEWRESDEEDRPDGTGMGRGRRLVLMYDNGQHCWNGPNRRTDVWCKCAETEALWRVQELEKCVYRMEVGTPAACEEVGGLGVGVEKEGLGRDEL